MKVFIHIICSSLLIFSIFIEEVHTLLHIESKFSIKNIEYETDFELEDFKEIKWSHALISYNLNSFINLISKNPLTITVNPFFYSDYIHTVLTPPPRV